MKIGKKFKNDTCSYIITKWYSYKNCTIVFNNGYIKENVNYSCLKGGNLTTPFCKTVVKVGFLGIGEYNPKNNKKCYIKWKSMLQRCYYNKYLLTKPSYNNCIVDSKWHCFQNFAQWYYNNYNSKFMEKWELDKDLLSENNKIYSEETCVFLPPEINQLLKQIRKPVKHSKKFKARFSSTYLGLFDNYNDAQKFIVEQKHKEIKKLVEKYKTELNIRAINKLLDINTLFIQLNKKR